MSQFAILGFIALGGRLVLVPDIWFPSFVRLCLVEGFLTAHSP